MIYLSIFLGLLLVAQHLHYERRLDKERAQNAAREISLLNRIQAPEVAVAQSLPRSDEPSFISAFDDEALSFLEEERNNTREGD